ncbi:MAG: ABC transporter substrate-binding protein [Exilispira sp.]
MHIFGKKLINLLIFIFLLLLFISSSLMEEFQDNFVVDSLGRKVAIKDYQRIGIINPSALKTFLFLNFDTGRIAGVDSYSIDKYRDKLTPKTENLGDFNNPNIELIVKQKIDLLILDQSFSIQKLYEIEKLNIPYFVYSTTPSSYEAIKFNIQSLSKLIKKEMNFEKLKNEHITSYEKKILSLKDKFLNKTILIIVWADNNITCSGADSYLTLLAEFAGFKYAINEKGWINISFEKMLTLNPDYIIVASSFVDKQFFSKSIFKNLKAVENKNIYFFNQQDEDVVLQPSFDLWQGFYEILIKFNL